jgi:hypothetical protein
MVMDQDGFDAQWDISEETRPRGYAKNDDDHEIVIWSEQAAVSQQTDYQMDSPMGYQASSNNQTGHRSDFRFHAGMGQQTGHRADDPVDYQTHNTTFNLSQQIATG